MTYYFNPAAVDAGIYNVGFQAKVRVVESSDNTIDGSDAVLEFDIHPWKAHAPGNLLASDAEFCDKIELSWTSVDNVIVGHCDYGYYQLYCDGAPLDITINNSYTHFTSGSHDYKLAFVATCGGSCSNAGQQTSEVTGSTLGGGNPPSGVSATNDLCDGQVKITWQWFGDNPTDFKVRRNGSLLATVTGDIRDYTDNTAAPGVQYNYDVGAGNVCGTMYYSSVSVGSAIPDPQTPTAPVATANYGTNNINITWTNVANATQIELIRYSEAGTATFDLTAGTTSYVDNDAGGCITYTYKVKTINSCDYRISAVSNNARIEPVLTNTFTSTKNLVCSKGYYNDKIVLNWDYDNQNIIEHFKIYRKEYSESGIGSVIESIDPTSTYADETAEAGIYYVYTIVGETTCEGDILSTPVNTYCQDIGFRIPAAVVAGSVTFAGGTGVRGVSIIAETDDDFGGNGLYFYSSSSNIRVPHVSGFSFSSGFSFQAWVKATSTGTTTLFQKGTQYKVQHSLNNITFTAGSQVLNLNFPQKADTFFCVNAVRTTDSLFVYVLYDELTVYKTGALRTSATSSNSDDIYIGYSSNAFTGYIDEVRVWNKGLTQEQVYNTSIRYIAGNESELKVYLRLNELFNSTVYDISRISSNFNENHGFVSGCSLSSTIPLSRQLSVKGITDANGNYLITGIPYTIGSIYTFTPVFEVHKFDPTMKQLYIGPGSNNHNNVDFIDVASFTVSGDIRYINTFFPVKGVYFYVDGQILTMADGTPLETDDMGQYEIEVPIGFHYIEVRKNGHVFVNTGRFPATAPTKYNFQAPIPYLPFVDSTLIKVVGKVTGGPIQAAKPIGLSKTVNNIGYSEMALTTQRAYDLTDKFYDFTGSWFNNYYRDDELTIQDSTVFILKYLSPKEISIYPAHETGEYVAWLLPEKYVVNSITAGDYTYGDEFHTVLDLTNSYSFTTEIDSVVIDLAITTQGDTLLYYRIDSVQYNANFDFIYRELPSISVTKVNGDLDFWEKEYTTRDGAVIPLVNADSSLKTLFPVLFQRGRYSLKFSVFEQYINSDNNYAIDNVPVTDGKVDVQNALAIDKDLMSYQLDSKGEVIYNFTGGLPNITTGGIGDYIKTMAIVAKTGNNGSISTPWLPYTDPQTGAEGPFRAYLLGGLATGNNFVTTGPNEIKMIIRDPPGSNSFASLESGTTFSQSSSYEVGSELSLNNSIKVDLGMKQIIWAGVGAGTITEIEQIADVTIGLEMSTTFTDNNTTSTSFTTTETWSTSEADDYVGGDGDLFIGNSSNIVYGLSIQVDLAPINMGEGFVGNPIEYNGEIYDIGITKGLRINPEFGTGFIFSKYHIENYLIPNLKLLRKLYLLNHTDIYTCVICNPEDPNFGMKNTTGSLTSAGYSGGDSYNFTIPLDWPGDSLFVDTIDFFNQQIEGWIAALERNEKEKVQSEMVQNISFDAGASYSNTVTNEKSEEFTSSFAFMISPSLSSTLGFEIAGIGMEWNMEFKTSATITNTNGTTQSTTTTFSYTLKDENAGDYLSVDIKKPKTQTGPVFITRGGQTMCPYEDAEITEYYQPGTLLGAATMRREIPIITCENPLQTDVLDGEPAIFHVQLSNISETGEDQWFLLSIDAASNQEGAYISMDGSDLGGGVMLLVAAGVTMNKYIYVEKIRPDHFEYENLAIVLGSSCQDDLTDTVRISAYFKPVCTTVELKTPSDLWVVNTNSDTTLSIKVDGYDLGHQSLEKILMQYRPTSTSSWTTLMSYYMYVVDFDIASEPKALIDGQSYLTYKFDMTGVQDRDYALRAVSVCFDGTVNETSAAYGVKDVKRPKVFGTPQPADGILSPGDDVMITFDENIEAGILTPWNFSVKGVLNGAPLMHQACLFFDGQQDYASSVTGVNLDNKSFTIEFWTRRGDLSEGVIFSQNELEIGFNSAGNFYCTLGDQTFQSWSINSAPVISDLVSWAHYSITYNIEDNYFSMFINDIQELVDIPVTNMFNCEGRMYIGRNSVGTKFFNGFLHEFRIWEKSLGFGTIASMRYQSLVGNEIGLGGYWTMSEASGDNTADKARNRNLFLFGAEWRVFPSGYSRVFNGNDEYVIINTGSTVVIDDLMDFTIEFYFKGQPQANTVLFSNGSANGIDDTPPYMHIWVVGFNVNGKLYVRNNGTTITANQED
ncbi:MAG: hypothetical protein HY738_06040, partial [Bacteroidia bacterium]|nr:hypothetical protein [Bacteroidia bacterium]